MTRFVDRGAVFAGWVGLGMALMIAIGLELIVAVQSLVFLAAPVAGLLVGWYANVRSERRRPVGRVLSNAAWAGLVTGLALAILYVVLRLLFIYADNGYPEFNRTDANGAPIGATCDAGPACTYARYVSAGRAGELAAAGVTDAATFEGYVLREQANGALLLTVATLAGALVGGAIAAGTGGERRVERAAVPG
jgi:hypothetical protein